MYMKMEEKKALDPDWIRLVQQAKALGFSIQDIRLYLEKQSQVTRS